MSPAALRIERTRAANDQADGLRRLFGRRARASCRSRHNPHVACGGVVLERLCDAARRRWACTRWWSTPPTARRPPREMALIDLPSCIERLSDDVSYLPRAACRSAIVDTQRLDARLPRRRSATPRRRPTSCWCTPARADLARLFAQPARCARCCWAADTPRSVTHAYAAMKLLAQRAGLLAHDLLLGADAAAARAPSASPRSLAELRRAAFSARRCTTAWSIDPRPDASATPTRD